MCNSNCKLCAGNNGFNHVNETTLKAEWIECPNSNPTVSKYYVSMIDTITAEVFTVVVSATSLHEARRSAWLDWWQSASLVR